MWFDDPATVSVRIGAIDGGGMTGFSAEATIASPVAPALVTVNGKSYGSVSITGGDFQSGSHAFSFVINDDDKDLGELNDLTWILEVKGSGKVDAYIDTTQTSGFITSNASPGVVVDSEQTIGFPGIAKNVLAVGSFVTKNEWTPAAGAAQQQLDNNGAQVVLGAISGFSSHGPPRRSTVITAAKPDITAPGEIVASALNSKGTEPAERIVKASPSGYYMSEGTSMASPAVAGSIALLLEKDPTLTVDKIRTIFAASAELPAGVTKPSPIWGAGKLDVLAALGAMSGADAGADGGSSSSSSSTSGASSSSSSTSGATTSSSGLTSSSSSGAAANDATGGSSDSGCAVVPGSTEELAVPAGFVVLGIALAFSRRSRRRV